VDIVNRVSHDIRSALTGFVCASIVPVIASAAVKPADAAVRLQINGVGGVWTRRTGVWQISSSL